MEMTESTRLNTARSVTFVPSRAEGLAAVVRLRERGRAVLWHAGETPTVERDAPRASNTGPLPSRPERTWIDVVLPVADAAVLLVVLELVGRTGWPGAVYSGVAFAILAVAGCQRLPIAPQLCQEAPRLVGMLAAPVVPARPRRKRAPRVDRSPTGSAPDRHVEIHVVPRFFELGVGMPIRWNPPELPVDVVRIPMQRPLGARSDGCAVARLARVMRHVRPDLMRASSSSRLAVGE